VAGLTAARHLQDAGFTVEILEAQSRAGGRIQTAHDPAAAFPVELGAEFIHGKPPEIWDLVRRHGLVAYEHSSQAVHVEDGRIATHEESGEYADKFLAQTKRRGKDESVADFAHRSRQPANVRKWALAFLEGFNAGPAERLGTKAIKRDMQAAEKIEGDRTFRILNGYDSLVRTIQTRDESIRLSTVVTKIIWSAGRAIVHAKQSIDGSQLKIACRCVIVTVSLGVLRAAPPAVGAITFEPEIPRVSEAVANLEFGDVYRATFRFAERFWEDNDELAKAGFWISQEKVFPTWWTAYPVIAPILTGWSAGPAAESLRGASRETVIAAALRSLSKILNRRIPPPQAVHFEDWHANPFVRGAYSYASVDSIPQRQALSRPVAGTLSFAGEATNTEGHAATVHGAIASGIRAARQAARSLHQK